MRPRLHGNLSLSRRLLLLVPIAGCLHACPDGIGASLVAGQRSLPGQSASLEERTVTLEGRVTTENGRTIPSGVMVRLEREGMLAFEQPANSAGQFEIGNIPKTYFRLLVTADGFQPYQKDFDFTHAAYTVVVNVTLSPLMKTPSARPSLPTLTDDKAPKKARSEYQEGARALQEKKWKEAESHLEKAVKEYDCYARARTDLAVVWSAQQQWPRAEGALQKALECDPDFLDAYSELGQLYYVEKKYAESAAVLKEGLRRSPGAWQFYYQLGAAHYRLRKYHDAEEEFVKAQSFNPAAPPEIHVKLADVYLRESAYTKAYAEMQAYLRAEPDGRFAAKIKSIMQQMESAGVLHAGLPQSPPPQPPKP